MSVVFWAWAVTAFFLALGEAVTGGLLVLPWAIGAALAASLEALHVPYGWQWAAFLVVSVAVFVVVQRLLARRR